jgi:Transposase IS66 family
LSDWVGQAVWLLQPIVDGIRRHVFAAEKIHGDDTPVAVLEPGLGRTRTGRLWAYVRDDRPFCGPAPPAAVYFYSPDRGGEHPAAHLAHFTGFLQADAYSGFGERVRGAVPAAAGRSRAPHDTGDHPGRLLEPLPQKDIRRVGNDEVDRRQSGA